MTKYEIMLIIRPTVSEEDRKALIDKLENVFTANQSKVVKRDEWGMRELAYEIEKHTKGYYVVLEVESTQEARTEFERIIGLSEDVIRHLTIKDVR